MCLRLPSPLPPLPSEEPGQNYSHMNPNPSPFPIILLVIDRQSVTEALQTGLIAIDSSIPIGCGQRELIVGDRQTGKTSISIDSILNQKYSTIFTVYTSLGQSSSSILQVFLSLVQKDAIFYLSMLMATASSSAVHQYLCAYREIYLLLR